MHQSERSKCFCLSVAQVRRSSVSEIERSIRLLSAIWRVSNVDRITVFNGFHVLLVQRVTPFATGVVDRVQPANLAGRVQIISRGALALCLYRYSDVDSAILLHLKRFIAYINIYYIFILFVLKCEYSWVVSTDKFLFCCYCVTKTSMQKNSHLNSTAAITYE